MSHEANSLTGNSLTGVARVGFWDEVSIRSIATELQSPHPNYGTSAQDATLASLNARKRDACPLCATVPRPYSLQDQWTKTR